MTSSKPRVSILIILKTFSLFEKFMAVTDYYNQK